MAKRKRLTPEKSAGQLEAPTLETKSMPMYPLGVAPKEPAQPPIAQVAGAAAAQAALDDIIQEMETARRTGRIVQSLPLTDIQADHLVRDRILMDDADMVSLRESLKARGQQTPIEVVDLGQGAYGLISGLRRLTALKALFDETQDPRFGQIQCLIRQLDTVSDHYVAMVEENEVRSNLSFYERSRLAAEAAKIGVFPTAQKAVQALFSSASASKRSKISSFLGVYGHLDGALRFPAAIPERLGLSMAAAIEEDRQFAPKLRDLLRQSRPDTAQAERSILERAVKRVGRSGRAQTRPVNEEIVPGITLQASKGRVVLKGGGLTEAVQSDLKDWLMAHVVSHAKE